MNKPTLKEIIAVLEEVSPFITTSDDRCLPVDDFARSSEMILQERLERLRKRNAAIRAFRGLLIRLIPEADQNYIRRNGIIYRRK